MVAAIACFGELITCSGGELVEHFLYRVGGARAVVAGELVGKGVDLPDLVAQVAELETVLADQVLVLGHCLMLKRVELSFFWNHEVLRWCGG